MEDRKRKKVYINREPVSGPWGGGNKTLLGLINALEHHADIVFDLDEKDIDTIFCFDPRPNDKGIWYHHFLEHREKFGSKIIQRVGDVGTHGKPDLTKLAYQSSHMSDFVIFPSDWARKYLQFNNKDYSIIHNSPMEEFFENRVNKEAEDELRIVTHHWSTNKLKGFDIYGELGNIAKNLGISFTYIGRYPDGHSTNGLEIIGPKDVNFLKNSLPSFDIYLTASMYEAGANHVLEGLASGLPVIYRDSGGSIPEYASQYGLEFKDLDTLVLCIESMRRNFKTFKKKSLSFSSNFNDTIQKYVDIILCES